MYYTINYIFGVFSNSENKTKSVIENDYSVLKYVYWFNKWRLSLNFANPSGLASRLRDVESKF